MTERWYREAVVYSLEVDTFQDSDGDGVGDLRGLIGRLDYLARLGVTCLWLNPIHPSPGRDDGYDVTDFYGVHPRLGTLGDMAELLHQASNRGIKVLLDLVVNHTSDQHPWFQDARSRPDSPHRDWYVWSDREPPDRFQGMVFPGEQRETWTFDETAGAWYYHRFYEFEPDLNLAHPAVREEIGRIVAFWLQLGVAGFRMDAAPFVIELTRPGDRTPRQDFDFLTELRERAQWRRGDSAILAEANVEPSALPPYFGDRGGSANRLHMLFDFRLNGALMLALARRDAEPLVEALRDAPRIPPPGQWVTFLRNHDENDLSRLTAEQREDVLAAFAPEPDMRLYDRGIRRRLATMLAGDRARIELAYSLQFSLPGTPAIRYGEEIGMGEDLRLRGRDAIRTPMQWIDRPNGGFSPAPRERLLRPPVEDGPYGYREVNVTHQRRDPHSLLSWFERTIRTLRECPEAGTGACTVLDEGVPPRVLAHRRDSPDGSVLFLHNLGTGPAVVDLGPQPDRSDTVVELYADGPYDAPGRDLRGLAVAGQGYRWIRLRRGPVRRRAAGATISG
ncbi:MAG TPA: alpha-amylase family protein [Candidatus Dormibacteraeota bacterium]